MKKIVIYLIIIVLMTNIILPNYVSAVETDTHSQYTAFSDHQAVQIGLEKYVGVTRALVIMFTLDYEDYWMKSRQERARIINNYKKNDPGYTYVDLLVKNDVTPSKQATTISPDIDFWFNQVLGLKLPKDISIYEGINSYIKELFGFHPSSLNDKVYRDNPVFFGDDMREYFDKNGKDKPKTTIFEKETLDWLYSPEGYLTNYFENRNNSSFTEAEVKTLIQPPGYNSDEFFKQLDFILNTTAFGSLSTGQVEITLGVVFVKSAIRLRSLFTPLKKLIPKSILSWFKFLEPNLPEIATGLKQNYVIRNGKNVTERSVSIGESKIGEFPSVVKALNTQEQEDLHQNLMQVINQAGMREWSNSRTLPKNVALADVRIWGNLRKYTIDTNPLFMMPVKVRPVRLGDVLGSFNKVEAQNLIGNIGIEGLIKLHNNLIRLKFGYGSTVLYFFKYPRKYLEIAGKFNKGIFEEGSILKAVRSDDPLLFDTILQKQLSVRTIEENGQPVVIFSLQGKDDLVTIRDEVLKIYEKELEPLRKFSKFDNPAMADSATRYLARRDVREEFKYDLEDKPIINMIHSHYYATDPSLKTKSDYTADLWDRLNQSIVQGRIKSHSDFNSHPEVIQKVVDDTLEEILQVSGMKGLEQRIFFNVPEAVNLFKQRIKAWDDAISLGNMTSTIKAKLKLEDNKFFKSVVDLMAEKGSFIKGIDSYKLFGKNYQQIWEYPAHWN
ncbi:MAG: hypothetical protein ACD_58C00028G0005 [uncultured bacterium]|nr:MAG: hypothetical protein ACD_58C00028G0005 [uncultured bacterium]